MDTNRDTTADEHLDNLIDTLEGLTRCLRREVMKNDTPQKRQALADAESLLNRAVEANIKWRRALAETPSAAVEPVTEAA